MANFKNTAAAAIDAKARNLGGNIKITNAVLNAEKVRAIRELHEPLGFSAREISEHFSVKVAIIQKVLRRETWAHVS